MKKFYHIEIEEILQNVYDIKAKSLEEAIEIARARYKNEKYILNENCLKETNFKEISDPTKIRNNMERWVFQ